MSGWVAAQRQVIVNSQASLDLGGRAHTGQPLAYALGVPLITRESLVGTVTLYSTAAFSESQSRLLQVIAPHLAQVLWTTNREHAAVHTSQSRQAAGNDLRVVAASERSRSLH